MQMVIKAIKESDLDDRKFQMTRTDSKYGRGGFGAAGIYSTFEKYGNMQYAWTINKLEANVNSLATLTADLKEL